MRLFFVLLLWLCCISFGILQSNETESIVTEPIDTNQILEFLKVNDPEGPREICSSPIFCQGMLLEAVQTSGLFKDSKTFVDMSMINSLDETLKNVDMFMRKTGGNCTRSEIQEFINQNFRSFGELEEYLPPDFNPKPPITREIENLHIKRFAKEIVRLWPILSRKVSQKVFEKPEKYSVIPVKNPFVVPGGRFREYYYWDTYWIIKGLLLSDMVSTAKGMVENLLSLVERFGYVPNGGRIYYISRSQPPVLTLIMADYVKYTKDYDFLRQHLTTLEKELSFWLTRRSTNIDVNGRVYRLAHYDSESNTPRVEAYKEDVAICSNFTEKEKKQDCYQEIKSAAESGWDFTSRWIFDEYGEPSMNMSMIATRRNLPVDLNSFLYKNFVKIYKFHLLLGQAKLAKPWLDLANTWGEAIEKVMYNQEDGIWYDFDAKLGRQRKNFAVSNITPLWAGALPEEERKARGRKALEYLKREGVLDMHGIPCTKVATPLQWDYPNAWTPFQNIIVFGLHNSGDEEAQQAAKEIAERWLNSLLKMYTRHNVMFEKYDARSSGQYGGGGEYIVQIGFGWTNGGILEIIDFYYRTKKKDYVGLDYS